MVLHRFMTALRPTPLCRTFAEELGIRVVPFDELVYLPFEDEFCPKDEVTAGTETISLSSLDIRERIRTGRKIPRWATFPEVVGELKKAYPPPSRQGFTVFFTGLSGSGKSTIARVLYAKMLEIGKRPVTLLDGDIVRQNLSNELSFSKEHRDINVRRIGFVASEITKNRGVAICAPIAPYAATRNEIRSNIEAPVVSSRFMWQRPWKSARSATERACTPKPGPVLSKDLRVSTIPTKFPRPLKCGWIRRENRPMRPPRRY